MCFRHGLSCYSLHARSHQCNFGAKAGSYEDLELKLAVGSRCHESDAAAFQWIDCRVHNGLYGLSWECAAESRWHHAEHLMRRFYIGAVGPRPLPESMAVVQRNVNAEQSLEQQLVRLLQADSQHFSVRNRLRMLRSCQRLCPTDASHDVALHLIVTRVVDIILFKLLGDGEPGSRATYKDFAVPASSPVLDALETFWSLLTSWAPDEPKWCLLRAAGADFQDLSLRANARRDVLQLNVGVVDQFEIRLSLTPASLVEASAEDAPRIVVKAALDALFAEDLECMAPLARGIREFSQGSRTLALNKIRTVIPPFAADAILSIDAAERAHAAMRQDISRHGPGNNVAGSINRMIVREMAAEHLRLGGRPLPPDPKQLQNIVLALAPAGACATQDPGISQISDVLASSVEPPSKVMRGGPAPFLRPGSAYLRLKNLKLDAASKLRGGRALSQNERDAVAESAKKEWSSIDGTAKKQIWKRLTLAVRDEKHVKKEVDASVTEEEPFRGLWGSSSSRDLPVSIGDLLCQGVGGRKIGQPHRFDRDLLVGSSGSPVEERVHTVNAESAVAVCLGCKAGKKNVCRVHGKWSEAPLPDQLDGICDRLSHWVTDMPKEDAKSCTRVLWVRRGARPCAALAADPDGSSRFGSMVLLVHPTFSPRMQFFCQTQQCGSPNTFFDHPAEFPFILFLSSGRPRMGGPRTTVTLKTSDELAVEMLAKGDAWTFTELNWEDPVDLYPQTLLAFRITGWRADVLPRDRAPLRQHKPYKLPAELVGDGDILPSNPGAAPPRGPFLGGEADGIDQYADGDPDDDVMEAYDGLYPDEVVDLEDDHLEYDIDPEYHTPPPEPNEEGEREHDDDPLEEMDVYDVALEEPGVIAVPLPTPMEAASAGEIEKLSGYVYCALEPWKSLPYLGRVTEWPDTAPREKRVCLLRCGLHDSCSVKIGRRHVSDDDLLEWLFSGEIPPEGADRFTRITLGGAHRDMWKHRT